MGSFIEIVQNYDQRTGGEDNNSDLTNWMALLIRFTDQPLPESLINQVNRQWSYYWAKDRLKNIQADDEYLNQCPDAVRHYLMLNYLYDDVIYRYRGFFQVSEERDSKFLYDVCFGLKPAKFDCHEDHLILDETDEVTDMFFIMEGVVGIGYYLMTQCLSKK